MDDAHVLSRVRAGLDAAGASWYEDHVCVLMKDCTVPAGQVALVLNPQAFKAYDAEHPERIVCLLVRRDGMDVIFCAMVNNRDVNIEANVRRWLTAPLAKEEVQQTDCCVCMRDAPTCKRMMVCIGCCSLLCERCALEIGDSDALQCPVCRQWQLSGPSFGTPLELLARTTTGSLCEAPTRCKDPAEALVDVIAALDGEVFLLPCIGGELLFESSVVVGRLTKTNRRIDGTMRVREARMRLRALCRRHLQSAADELVIYSMRGVFAIDKERERPVEERSAFRLTRTHLLQMRPDEWDLIHDAPNVAVRKVEYMQLMAS